MYNLSYTYRACEDCGGSGFVIWDSKREHCVTCDGDGQLATRRTMPEIIDAHIAAAENLYYSLGHDSADGTAYRRGKAETHMQLAVQYAAIAQADQLKRIADMMEAYLEVYADPAVLLATEVIGNRGAEMEQEKIS